MTNQLVSEEGEQIKVRVPHSSIPYRPDSSYYYHFCDASEQVLFRSHDSPTACWPNDVATIFTFSLDQ
jgi:hypothetical protein